MDNMCQDLAMHRVVVLALPGVVPFELAIPSRLFGAALGSDGKPLYSVTTCSLDGGPVDTSADFAIAVDHDHTALAQADTVVIPPSASGREWGEQKALPAPLRDALGLVRPGARVMAICTGSFVLAAAGILDGRRVTTHWRESDRLQGLYPDLVVDADVLFIDNGNVLTSAGVSAGIDLCLHVIRRDHGSEIANEAARSCVVPPWRDGGQAQYIRRPVVEADSTTTAPARAWALEHLDRPLVLAELAARSNMSVRTFSRRFQDEVGVSPMTWLTQQRVERARELLESTDLTVDRIAEQAGFGSGGSLRQHLLAATGVSPRAYRRTFRAAPVGD
ncbi:helix-turn-helix domain-containing protein [Micromonospora sp. NPDC047465]|uniref:GlxA family transcriptional regulator n=1 Tax=Micromonospora sp. NPDC047465 TaxID=3154813 RepID=UPI0033C571AE